MKPPTDTAAPQGDGSTLSTPMTDRFAECVFGVELVNASLARQLERDRARLRDALERAQGCIKGLLNRTPVRDVSETLAEIEAALK